MQKDNFNEMNDTHRALLNKYLDGHCTPEELAQVDALLDQPEIEELLHRLMEEREAMYDAMMPDEALADKVTAMEAEVFGRIEAKEAQLAQAAKQGFNIGRLGFMRYAAIWAGVVLLSSIAVWQVLSNRKSEQEISYGTYSNAEAYPVRYTLPDSTVVYLGSGGELRYPTTFAADSRQVALNGDAFFDVIPDKHRPFSIQTGSMTTQVLGTSFKIDAQQGFPMVVSVATGRVSVSSDKGEQTRELAILTPGLKLTYNEATDKFEQGEVDIESLRHWTDGDLVFDEQPLRLVMQTIEKRYGIKVSLADNEVGGYRVSGSFEKGQDIESVMQMLGIIGKFQYKFNDRQSLTVFK